MIYLILHLLCFASGELSPGGSQAEKYRSGSNTDRVAAYQFLHENDKKATEMCNMANIAQWNYAANLTEENKKKMLEVQVNVSKFAVETWENATSFAWKSFKDENIVYRWFKLLSILGTSALPEDKYSELVNLVADMTNVYSTAKVCDLNNENCNLSLEPELTNIMANSRNYEELTHIWKEWRDASGKKVKGKFLQYAELSNEAAVLNGFSDYGELWREGYESETFQQDLEDLWKTVKPLYENLHAYVRKKLRNTYGSYIRPDGPIPASVLGNMWGQTWSNIYDIVTPYPDKKSENFTKIFQEKGVTMLKMVNMSDEFFTSLDLMPMTPEFWKNSIFEKPKDRDIVCHASAWDFCDGKDVRIKMCGKANMVYFTTVHHEMGHIEYFLQYSKQPQVFRNGANPGFHEAVGDTLALSVSTPNHLKSIGLLEEVSEDEKDDINFLMEMALQKIAFLPFGYLIDQWRWKVFSGDIKTDEMNNKWWEMRSKYQGLCPPVNRTEEDFDPGAKYHVVADTPYISYFVSYIIQFQFHKALCKAAGYNGSLHKCDIYRSEEAGKVLSTSLSQGCSMHWTEVMGIITEGETKKMDASPLMEYFSPLMDWLRKENKNEGIGWKTDDYMSCPSLSNTE